MASINSLATETLDAIFDLLPQSGKSCLSQTSRRFKDIGIPHLYRSVDIYTRKASTARSFIQAASQYGHLVHSLRVVVSTAVCHLDHCTDCDPRDKMVKPTADIPSLDLLGGKYDTLLPNLDHIAVKFPDRFGKHRILSENSLSSFDERPGGLRQALSQWGHIENDNNKRVDAVFTALSWTRGRSETTANTITHLTFDNLPKFDTGKIQGWANGSFYDLLGGLSRFDLSHWAGESTDNNSVHGKQQRYNPDGYTAFLASLSRVFFCHLKNDKHLRFQGSLHAFIGQVDPCNVTRKLPLVGPWSYLPNNLPMLKKLDLVHVMVDTPLLEFLETRIGKPAFELKLENTWAYDRYGPEVREDNDEEFHGPVAMRGDGGGKWATIIDGITDLVSCPDGLQLKKFELTPREKKGDGESHPVYRSLPFRYANLITEDEESDKIGCYAQEMRVVWDPRERQADRDAEARLMEAIAQST